MESARIAVVDLGTNSARLALYELRNAEVRFFYERKEMVRIGDGVFVSGTINREAVARTTKVLREYKETIESYEATLVRAVATSALREASNAAEVVASLKSEGGIAVEVISGEEEARLIALGILSYERIADGRTLLVDVGGGSLELIAADGATVLHSESLSFGVARIKQNYLPDFPASPSGCERLRHDLREALQHSPLLSYKGLFTRSFGASGTVRAFRDLLDPESHGERTVGREPLSALLTRLLPLTRDELLTVPRMLAKRTDFIFAGGVVLEEVLKAFDVEQIHYTDAALKEGLAYEYLRKTSASA